MSVLHSRAIAEEAVQDACLAIWTGRHRFHAARGTESAWVFAVVRHRILDRLRAESRHTGHDVTSIDDATAWLAADYDTAATALVELEKAEVHSALDTLPVDQRLAIDHACFEGLTNAEVAARLRVPLGTIKGRLRLGRERLENVLRARGYSSSRVT